LKGAWVDDRKKVPLLYEVSLLEQDALKLAIDTGDDVDRVVGLYRADAIEINWHLFQGRLCDLYRHCLRISRWGSHGLLGSGNPE
jgi:hypothetical protein